MFNLTVDTAHTFYVGVNGWLVHNGSFKLQSGTGMAANFGTTGFHLNMGNKEVQVSFRNGEFTAFVKGGKELSATEMKQLKQFINSNKDEVRRQLQMGLEATDTLESVSRDGRTIITTDNRIIDNANRFRQEGRDLMRFLKEGCLY